MCVFVRFLFSSLWFLFLFLFFLVLMFFLALFCAEFLSCSCLFFGVVCFLLFSFFSVCLSQFFMVSFFVNAF